MKVEEIVLRGIAGYSTLEWTRVQPDLNIIVGRNGSGKSTLLHAIAFVLKQVCGQRGEDLLTRRFGDGIVEMALSGLDQRQVFRIADVLKRQGTRRTETSFNIVGFEENRQPQNTVGKSRTSLTQRPEVRYRGTVSELRILLQSSAPTDRALADEVIAECSHYFPLLVTDWQDIRKMLATSRQKELRPVSCGEFDILAIVLDLVRLRRDSVALARPSFVLLDNPDTYLHPACLDPLLGMFRAFMPDAQIFVASHSLRLLCHKQPRTVFWLNRDQANVGGVTELKCVRDLDDGSRGAFFDLYGDDVSSAVLSLLISLESPEYYAYLCDSALPATVLARPDPTTDRQMLNISEHVQPVSHGWLIFDYGAGKGDLLEALLDRCPEALHLTYVAWTQEASPELAERVEHAVSREAISAASRALPDPWHAPAECDAIVMCNVCHEIPLPDVARVLARLLRNHLAPRPSSKLVIHEVETLSTGERGYVMWDTVDLEGVFGEIEGLAVKTERTPTAAGVPLETTVINPVSSSNLPDDLEELLLDRFRTVLPAKLRRTLEEIEALQSQGSGSGRGLTNAVRQRKTAFLTGQVANLLLAARRLSWSTT